jgi:hypothetical protein
MQIGLPNALLSRSSLLTVGEKNETAPLSEVRPETASLPPAPIQGDWSPKNLALLLLLAVLAFMVMGYHPGLEDDAFYLSAIKQDLHPALFPYDAVFFRLQFQATIFDKLIALSIRLTHVPIDWGVLLWQFGAVFFVLHGCWRIARRCFSDSASQWAAVCLVGALLTLPVSGTGINLADQYLHPRILATVAILAAIVNVMDRRWWRAAVLLAIAFTIHAIMAVFGISFCVFLLWVQHTNRVHSAASIMGALLIPFGWIFDSGSDAWRRAAATRSFYFLANWHWYEWLGVFAPPVLLFGFQLFLQHRSNFNIGTSTLPTLISTLLYYSIFQTIVGLSIMFPPALERLRPFEPMRFLHLLYALFFLLLGGVLGSYVLQRRPYRWALLFVPLTAVMLCAQLHMFPASAHLELPGRSSANPWLQAFAWIRSNTPVDSRFALNPRYLELPGEDYHGFGALAERSALADYIKDGGMVARVPELAPRWLTELSAQNGWQDFQTADFERLKQQFGVNWIVLSRGDAMFARAINDDSPSRSMTCPYGNEQVVVCRLY